MMLFTSSVVTREMGRGGGYRCTSDGGGGGGGGDVSLSLYLFLLHDQSLIISCVVT